jgi:hypothetical protein
LVDQVDEHMLAVVPLEFVHVRFKRSRLDGV